MKAEKDALEAQQKAFAAPGGALQEVTNLRREILEVSDPVLGIKVKFMGSMLHCVLTFFYTSAQKNHIVILWIPFSFRDARAKLSEKKQKFGVNC